MTSRTYERTGKQELMLPGGSFNFLKQQVLDGSENPKCPLEKVSERAGKMEKAFRQQSGVLTGETNVFAVE